MYFMHIFVRNVLRHFISGMYIVFALTVTIYIIAAVVIVRLQKFKKFSLLRMIC